MATFLNFPLLPQKHKMNPDLLCFGWCDGSFCLVVMNAFLDFCSTSPDAQIIVVMLTCPLCYAQGSDTEGRADGASDSETKADTGIPDVPVPADDTPEVLNKALSGLSSRWRLCICLHSLFISVLLLVWKCACVCVCDCVCVCVVFPTKTTMAPLWYFNFVYFEKCLVWYCNICSYPQVWTGLLGHQSALYWLAGFVFLFAGAMCLLVICSVCWNTVHQLVCRGRPHHSCWQLLISDTVSHWAVSLLFFLSIFFLLLFPRSLVFSYSFVPIPHSLPLSVLSSAS